MMDETILGYRAAVVATVVAAACAYDNGVALTPPMGWNSVRCVVPSTMLCAHAQLPHFRTAFALSSLRVAHGTMHAPLTSGNTGAAVAALSVSSNTVHHGTRCPAP